MIGKIVRRPLREVWRHEALDFTTWLVENIDVLSEALDLPLQDAKREQAAGDFNVDLVAEDDSGSTVVIENQLERPSRQSDNLFGCARCSRRGMDSFRSAARAHEGCHLAQ